jgi:Urea transporter
LRFLNVRFDNPDRLSTSPSEAEVNVRLRIGDWSQAFLAGFAQLVFCSRPVPGALTALGLLAYSPQMLAGASAGAAIGTVLERWTTGLDRKSWREGIGGFNPALLGIFGCGAFVVAGGSAILILPLLVLCTALTAFLRKPFARLGLFALSSPAYLTALIVSLALQGPGSWWWISIAPGAFIPGGNWVVIGCLAGAMTWESPAAAGWTVCIALIFYYLTTLLGLAPTDGMELWGVVVPLSAFGAQRLLAWRSPAAPGIALAAATSGAIIWWLWHAIGLDNVAPPLIAPAILTLWGMMYVQSRVHKRPAVAHARHPLLRSTFVHAVFHLWRGRLLGWPLVLATGPSPIEAGILGELRADAADISGGMTKTRAGRRRLWEASDILRRAAKEPCPNFRADFVIAGDCIGQVDAYYPRYDAAGRADRIRCLGCGSVSPAPPVGLWRRIGLTCASCGGDVVPDIRRFVPLDSATIRAQLNALLPERAVGIILPGAAQSAAVLAFVEKRHDAKWRVIQLLERPSDPLPGVIAIVGQTKRTLYLFRLLGCVRMNS